MISVLFFGFSGLEVLSPQPIATPTPLRASLQSTCAPFGTRLSHVHVPDTVTVTLLPLTLTLSMWIAVGFGALANAEPAIAASAATSAAMNMKLLRRVRRDVLAVIEAAPPAGLPPPPTTQQPVRVLSPLRKRMQPCEGRPGISCGSSVPWIPTTPPPGHSLSVGAYALVPTA